MAGNIYRRGKTFWGRVQIAGNEYRGSLRTSDRAEARKRLQEWLEGVGKTTVSGDNRLSWEAAVVHYVNGDMASVSESTAKRYKVSFRQVGPILRKYHLDQIGPREITALVAERRKAGATNATINRDLTAISRVLAAGLGKGANEHNAARDYDRSLNRERRDPIELPTADEIASAAKKAPFPGWSDIIRFASLTGMRQAEILALDWRNVDLERAAITLHRTKGRRLRVIPLTGPLLDEAADLLADRPREARQPLVFGKRGETPLRNFPSRFAAWRAEAKVPFRFHDLRHWFAVTYLQRGGNIYDLQRIMGHGSVKTTEIYLDYLTPAERKSAQWSAQS